MEQSKEEFLSTLLELSNDSSASERFINVGYALLNRSDFTPEDYISLMVDSNNPFILRHLAIACYAQKVPDSGIDDAVIAFISDSEVMPSLRTIAIALLHEHFDAQDEALLSALLSAAESKDGGLVYNAIKALEHVWPEQALCIAQNIYADFENEPPARINIACKVLVRHYTSQQLDKMNEEEVKRFVEKSLEIYNFIANDEIKRVIPGVLALLPAHYTEHIAL